MISPGEAGRQLHAEAERVRLELRRIVRVTAERGVMIAREMFGVLQPEWEPLAESTKDDKARMGFSPPDYSPLLRSGDLRDSVHARAYGLTGEVYSNDPKMVFSELGTASEPARPVLEPAVVLAVVESDELLRELMDSIT